MWCNSLCAGRTAGFHGLSLPHVPEGGRRTVCGACKVSLASFAWTRGEPGSFRSSSAAERHFCTNCGTPLTFWFLDGDAIEVTTGSLDAPALAPPTKNFGAEARLSWVDLLLPGRLPDTPTAGSGSATRVIISRQHPDHETPDG